MHPTGGTLRVFRRFAWLGVDSDKMALSYPAHQRVTQAVRRTESGMTNPNQIDPLWSRIETGSDYEIQRVALAELRRRYLPYADANFDRELQLSFGSCFWEMYLACALLDRGFPLVPKSKRNSAGPDLCIGVDGNRIWVEAIAPRAGEGPDAVPALSKGGWIPEPQIVLRYRAAVEEKHGKWLKYVRSRIVSADEPYLVALNGFQIPHGNNAFPDEVPYQVQSVLPLGAPSVTIDRETGQVLKESFETRWHTQKKSGAQVPTGVFLDPAYAGISGLLFSSAHPLYLRATGIGSLSHLHNPNAEGQKTLPRGWAQIGREYWVEKNQLLQRSLPDGA